MTEKKVEQQAADTLLGKGDKFTLRYMGGKINLSIRPQYLATMIAISKQAAYINEEALENNTIMQVIGSAKDYCKPIARAVAHGILNNRLKRALFARPLAWILLNRTTATDMRVLLALIKKHSNADDFFVCTVSLAQMNRMKPRSEAGKSREEKPSGETSQGSQKTSA